MSKYICVLLCLTFPFFSAFAQDKIIHQKSNDAFRELSDSLLTLRFYNALNGNPIQGANVTVQKVGSYITDDEGMIDFPAPFSNGKLSVTFNCKGYVKTSFNVDVMVGSLFFNRFSVSPSLLRGVLRIVLDWDADPKDLDAHLVKEGSYHISFRNMRSSSDGAALLDRDARNGYGPETITINSLDANSRYEYYVHNYSEMHKSNATGLSHSRATVKVYSNAGLQKMYQIPEDRTGLIWHVFRIENGEIVDVSEIGD